MYLIKNLRFFVLIMNYDVILQWVKLKTNLHESRLRSSFEVMGCSSCKIYFNTFLHKHFNSEKFYRHCSCPWLIIYFCDSNSFCLSCYNRNIFLFIAKNAINLEILKLEKMSGHTQSLGPSIGKGLIVGYHDFIYLDFKILRFKI